MIKIATVKAAVIINTVLMLFDEEIKSLNISLILILISLQLLLKILLLI